MSKGQMITEILNTLNANQVYISGDLFFSLAFRTDAELRKICQELHIKVK